MLPVITKPKINKLEVLDVVFLYKNAGLYMN